MMHEPAMKDGIYIRVVTGDGGRHIFGNKVPPRNQYTGFFSKTLPSGAAGERPGAIRLQFNSEYPSAVAETALLLGVPTDVQGDWTGGAYDPDGGGTSLELDVFNRCAERLIHRGFAG